MMACACFKLHVQEASKLAGYHFPTLRGNLEKNYASPSEKWYSESPQPISVAPATKRQLEADLDEMSSHSSDPDPNVWDSIGKTPGELWACCAQD